MCLGIPGRVVEIVEGYADQLALVDVEGARRRINVGMLDAPPAAGDWVLLHMGFAMEIIDAAKAAEALSGLEMMGSGVREPQAREPDVPEPEPEPEPVAAVAAVAAVVSQQPCVRRRFEVRGVVQGVGFRPFVYVTATELALTGSVANTGSGVVAEVEGDAAAVAEFARRLRADTPPLAVVESVAETDQPPAGEVEFTIADSSVTDRVRTLVSPDTATCPDCLTELRDPADRRYRHPFITCTHCGPRFTIITGMPYDRAATTMAAFEMCHNCRAEYGDPRDRRFHAQPIACPACGPRLELVGAKGEVLGDGDQALCAARRLLAGGKIVAIKGLGGYHLACDARDEAAVSELRRRKERGGKPFAVMVANLDVAEELVAVTDDERALLTGPRKPIVLLPRREPAATGSGVAYAVAPGNPDLGVLLPYTPLHVLLFGIGDDTPGPDVLVMTSGNRSGEPIVTDDAKALTELAPLADAWLRHDRPIQVPCDDSVSRFVAGAELPVRRSRGYAPLPLALPFDIPPLLAAGADLKNTCALGEGGYAWVSQHIGDMDDLATADALTRTVAHLGLLTGVEPERLVVDAHPGYRSGAWARAHAKGRAVRTVQHHHAHIASVLGEHGLGPGESVIGFAYDGTGHGPDGAVWGGETLIADYKSCRRAAHLAYVPLAGGDASVRRPYRMALAHLRAAGIEWDEKLPAVAACPAKERDVLAHQFATDFGCVPTSSMGRLFDAVASLAGVRHEVAYEAEAAIALEGLARSAAGEPGEPGESADGSEAYAFTLDVRRAPPGADEPVVADPGPVIRAVVSDVRAGVPPELIAARFHAAVVALTVELAELCRDRTGLGVVALGGGVFQNAVLLGSTQGALRAKDFTVLRPRLLPPNDGGIAFGQLLVAASG